MFILTCKFLSEDITCNRARKKQWVDLNVVSIAEVPFAVKGLMNSDVVVYLFFCF